MSETEKLDDIYLKESFSDQSSGIDPESWVSKNKIIVGVGFVGMTLIVCGFVVLNKANLSSDKLEIIVPSTESQKVNKNVVVEIAGAVVKPGVYELPEGSRVEDLLVASGGVQVEADRNYLDKNVNRAAKVSDGQKLYIPFYNQQLNTLSAEDEGVYQSVSSGNNGNLPQKVNINTASQKELETLWGIGPVTAQNIIEQRPYSNSEELLSKKIIKQNVYDRNKDLLTAY